MAEYSLILNGNLDTICFKDAAFRIVDDDITAKHSIGLEFEKRLSSFPSSIDISGHSCGGSGKDLHCRWFTLGALEGKVTNRK